MYSYPTHFLWRIVEAIFKLLAFLRVGQLLTAVNQVIKPNTRRLTGSEIALTQSVFGDTIRLDNVRIDASARIGCRKWKMAYVAFEVINCWGDISDAHFIHELVHVWQYQKVGMVYIPRALWAQSTAMGYNYGGEMAISCTPRPHFLSLNYEQQADLVADYFCLNEGLMPRWCVPDKRLLPYFEAILEDTGFVYKRTKRI